MSLRCLPADCPMYVIPVMSGQRKEVHKYTYKLCWQYTGKKEYTRSLQERLWITEHTVTVLSLLYKLSNCLFHTSLLQSAEGQQNRKQSLVKLHINMKYFTETRNLATTIIIRNAFQPSKKAALSVHRNQKDLLSLVSAYKVVYSHTRYCLMKPYTENSALKIDNGKYASGGKSTNVIKCSLFCSKEM